eukprot:414932_1
MERWFDDFYTADGKIYALLCGKNFNLHATRLFRSNSALRLDACAVVVLVSVIARGCRSLLKSESDIADPPSTRVNSVSRTQVELMYGPNAWTEWMMSIQFRIQYCNICWLFR